MFNEPLTFEGQTITLDGVAIDATCGPERKEPFSEFEGSLVVRMQVIGSVDDLPTEEGDRVDINGNEWDVESSSIVSATAVVTFIRYLG